MTTTPATQAGPHITVKASCFNCPFVQSESYRVQSDSGHDVRCAHPSFDKPKRVGDTVWDTPDFCPVADIPAIRAMVNQAHSLPGDVGTRELIFQQLRGTMPDGSANRIADKILAALTPSALSGDAGEGEKVAAWLEQYPTPLDDLDMAMRIRDICAAIRRGEYLK